MNTGRGAHLLSKRMGQTHFSVVGLATPPRACYLPSIAGTHLYTWVKRSNGKVPYYRTQHIDRNGALTHNLLFMNPALIRYITHARPQMDIIIHVSKLRKIDLFLVCRASIHVIHVASGTQCCLPPAQLLSVGGLENTQSVA